MTECFVRAITAEAGRYPGLGAGLFLANRIVEYHGGRIWFAPAAPGRGARFLFTLPADEPQEEPAP